MTPGERAAVRGRLEEFAAERFAPLSRSDQREKSATYVRGLLLDGRRESMQPMAERLGVDEQGLQKFISSTWAVEPVRQRLARRAVEVIAPDAWVPISRAHGVSAAAASTPTDYVVVRTGRRTACWPRTRCSPPKSLLGFGRRS